MGKGIIAVLKLTPNKSMIKRALRFALLPEFGRGLKATPAPGAQRNPAAQRSFLTSMLVQVFATIGLLEKTHPWVNTANRVQIVPLFSYVLGKLDWKHAYRPAPMIAISSALLLVMGLFVMTSFAGNMAIGAGQAYAADSSLFSSTSPGSDLALKYINRAFGVDIEGVSSSSTSGVVEGFQRIMGIYSTAMLILGGFILFYIISTAVMATAHEGRFGGNSFNQVWAPIRLVVAIGLLVPLPMAGFNGYNSGQYIVMKIAELGSGLANNIWVPFARALAEQSSVIGTPNVAPAASAVRTVLINEFCMDRHNKIRAYLVGAGAGEDSIKSVVRMDSDKGEWFVDSSADSGLFVTNYTTEESPDGGYCGSVTYEKASESNPHAQAISAAYEEAYFTMREKAKELAAQLNTNNSSSGGTSYIELFEESPGAAAGDTLNPFIATEFVRIVTEYQQDLANAVKAGQEANSANAASDALSRDVEDMGWVGAAVWFNTIARLNGEIASAARGIPTGTEPSLKSIEGEQLGSMLPKYLKKGIEALESRLTESNIGIELKKAGAASSSGAVSAGDVVAPSVIAGLSEGGLSGLLSLPSIGIGSILKHAYDTVGFMDHMGYGADARMSEVNPLAELAIIGDNLMTHSVVLFGMAGSLFAANDDGKFIFLAFLLASFAAVGFTAGIVLLYVTPLMPFIHFLFAVVAWLMSILEALISIPLVAVAHLTTKGEGVSGDLARTSYFMVFSIFLRPVLLIIGMVVALLMLSVAVGVLNDLFKSAITGYMGNKVNGGFSIIMYTIMYVTIAFSLCNMCFKLIEDIPNRALTWIGQSGAREVSHDEKVASILGRSGDDIFVGGFVKNVGQTKGLLKGGMKK